MQPAPQATGAFIPAIAARTNVFNGAQWVPFVETKYDGTTIHIDCRKGNNWRIVLKNNATLKFLHKVDGWVGNVQLVQNSSGNHTIALPDIDTGAAGPPTLSTAANAFDILSFMVCRTGGGLKMTLQGSALGFSDV